MAVGPSEQPAADSMPGVGREGSRAGSTAGSYRLRVRLMVALLVLVPAVMLGIRIADPSLGQLPFGWQMHTSCWGADKGCP